MKKSAPKNPEQDRVILAAHHLELTEAIRDYTHEKTEKLFRHELRIIRLRVELESRRNKSGPSFLARGIISMRGPDLVASETCEDLYTSIDGMVHKLDRMLRIHARQKEYKRNHPHPIDLAGEIPKVMP